MERKNITQRQMWTAAILTAGEFITAFFLLIHEGHFFALYLAVTYAVRETPGGKEYHTVFIELCRGCRDHFLKKK